METAHEKVKGQVPQQQNHSNLDRNHYNVIDVVAGAILTENVLPRGA